MRLRVGREAVGAGDVEDALVGLAVFVDPALDDLRSLEPGFPRVAGGLDEEARRVAGLRSEFAAHRHAAGVRSFGRVVLVREIVGIIVAGEEPHAYARARRGKRLLAAQGRVDRLASVLLGPHTGQPRGAPLDHCRVEFELNLALSLSPVGQTAAIRGSAVELAYMAEVLVLLHRSGRIVAVTRTDEAEEIGVRLDLALYLETGPQRVSGVGPGGRTFGERDRSVFAERHRVLRPDLEIGPLVVRRQRRMRLRGPLVLCDLHQRLVAPSLLRIGRIDRLASPVGAIEHLALAPVRVVRDRERFDPVGALLVEPRPEVFGVDRVDSAERQRGHVVAGKDHVAVKVHTARRGGEFVGHEGREAPRIVVALCRRDRLLPDRANDRRGVEARDGFASHPPVECAAGFPAVLRVAAPHLHRHGVAAQGVEPLVHQFRPGDVSGVGQRTGDAEILRVVGDREEVERPAPKADRVAERVGKGLSLGEAVRVVGGGSDTEVVGVDRVLRVNVQIAEVGVAWRARAGRTGRSRSVLWSLRFDARQLGSFRCLRASRSQQRYCGDPAVFSNERSHVSSPVLILARPSGSRPGPVVRAASSWITARNSSSKSGAAMSSTTV